MHRSVHIFLNVLVLVLFKAVLGDTNSFHDGLDYRIVGGEIVSLIDDLPYVVSIQLYNQHFCGGAIFDKNYVISAGHCFQARYPASRYKVRVGSVYTSRLGQTRTVCNITVHPGYSELTLDNDIAILTLCEDLPFNSTSIRPVQLRKNPNISVGSYGIISGWGYQSENGSVSPILLKTDVPITTRTKCIQMYRELINITENMVCAGYTSGGKDACQGDSGGPFVLKTELIGLVSFGMGCAREYPGVYTNVARYYSWIVNTTNFNESVADISEDKSWIEEIEDLFSSGGRVSRQNFMILSLLILLLLKFL